MCHFIGAYFSSSTVTFFFQLDVVINQLAFAKLKYRTEFFHDNMERKAYFGRLKFLWLNNWCNAGIVCDYYCAVSLCEKYLLVQKRAKWVQKTRNLCQHNEIENKLIKHIWEKNNRTRYLSSSALTRSHRMDVTRYNMSQYLPLYLWLDLKVKYKSQENKLARSLATVQDRLRTYRMRFYDWLHQLTFRYFSLFFYSSSLFFIQR